MNVQATTRLRRSAGVQSSRLGGEVVLLDASGRTLRGLNGTAGLVWELLDGQKTAAEVAGALSRETGAALPRVTQDVLALLEQLLERRLVEEVHLATSDTASTSSRSVMR